MVIVMTKLEKAEHLARDLKRFALENEHNPKYATALLFDFDFWFNIALDAKDNFARGIMILKSELNIT